MLNCYDANYSSEDASITVKGGTFVDYDPSKSLSENPTANFVASGYSVSSATDEDGHTYYTVSASTSTDSE